MSAQNLIENTMTLDRQGRSMPVYICAPGGTGRYPAVIIVHEIFGLNSHIQDIAQRFASNGFCAYAPDLFAGYANAPIDRSDLNGMRQLWQSIPDRALVSDLQAVYELAKLSVNVDATKVGTIGYCMGGAIALMFACSTAGIGWIADYYGRIRYPQLSDNKVRHPIEYVSSLSGQFLGLFSGHDELIPQEHIEELKKSLAEAGHHFEIKVYPDADHAFFNDTRDSYNKDAAEDAWTRTLAFVAKANHSSVAG